MKNQDLHKARYQRSCEMLGSMIQKRVPQVMIQHEARLLLEACYGGPWKAIAGLVKYRLKSIRESLAMGFERTRSKVFHRIPSSALEIAERIAEEDIEIRKMVNEL